MRTLHVKYLLVGGGIASYSAAQAIRARDSEGSILLVGQEINRPYDRSALSKAFLRRQVPREVLFAAEPGWFDKQRIDLRTGRRVANLDTARAAAALDNGEFVSYDRLLIATGSRPVRLTIPGADLPNVFYLRTLADEVQLHNAIEKARAEGRPHANGRGRAVVVGAGLLGVETAGSLTQLGLGVDLVASKPGVWNRFAGESTGRLMARFLEGHGVSVHAGCRPLRLEGDGRVQRVVLDDGRTLECDLAVACVGAAASKDVLRGTPISAEKAILVDAHCRTNVPGVYAAGDCCAVLDPRFGKHRWFDHWDHAVVTGTLAGRNMAGAGADELYDVVSPFTTEVFGLTTTVWGESRLVDRRLVRGTPKAEAPNFVEIGVAADGRVAQVVAVGHQGEDEILRELVARRFEVDGNQEAVKDPSVPLQGLLG